MTDNSKQSTSPEEQADVKGMRPIWYFVGLVLLIMGAVLVVTGIYYAINPIPSASAVAHLHPNIWWGGVMVIAGGLFLYVSKDDRVY